MDNRKVMVYFHDDLSPHPHGFTLSRGQGYRWEEVLAWAKENLGDDPNELRWLVVRYGMIAIASHEEAFIFRMWWC
jgi:hypothetical protein